MGLGPVHATQTLMKKFNKKVSDFDVIELNEAFSAQSLGCIKELDLDLNKVNPRGGSIAIGHPLGVTGTRIIHTAALELQKTNKRYALAAMCVGVVRV